MGRTKNICGCNICRYSHQPIDTRTINVHKQTYGLYTRDTDSTPVEEDDECEEANDEFDDAASATLCASDG
jgi:hypothetical protein